VELDLKQRETVTELADAAGVPKSTVLMAINNGHLTAYRDDADQLLIEWNRDRELFVLRKGAGCSIRRVKSSKDYGSDRFTLNKIKVTRKLDVIGGKKYHCYRCRMPDGTEKAFISTSETTARYKAHLFCTSHTEFMQTSADMKLGGLVQQVSLTTFDLKKILALLPEVDDNYYLLRKLRKALENSFNKGIGHETDPVQHPVSPNFVTVDHPLKKKRR